MISLGYLYLFARDCVKNNSAENETQFHTFQGHKVKITDLPPEVCAHICSHLYNHEIVALKRSCKQMCDIVNEFGLIKKPRRLEVSNVRLRIYLETMLHSGLGSYIRSNALYDTTAASELMQILEIDALEDIFPKK